MKVQKRVPKLRFEEFSGEWETKKLGLLCSKIGSGSTPSGGQEVYQQTGIPFIRSQNVINNELILDNTCIPESINSKMKGSIVKSNDILLNITGGSIGRSCVVPKGFKIGNVNQHVSIIRLKKDEPKFIQSFLASYRGQKLILRGQTGSGREGLNFQSIRGFKINIPTLPEQQKIAAFLSAVDKKIAQLQQKKHLLEQYKKGVILQIFSQQLRFTKPDGRVYPDWEFLNLKNVLLEHKTKNAKNEIKEVFSVAKEKGVVNQIEHLGRSYAADSILHYKIVKPYDVIYTKSPTKDFPFGIIKQNLTNRTGVVSPLYVVLKPINKSVGFILHCYFESWINTYNYLNPLVQKGAKNTMNINNDDFLKGAKIKLPISDEEQTQIADFLSAIDKKIAMVQTQIEHTQMFKKGLLQQLFV